MSAAGDYRFYTAVREKLAEAVERLTEQLINAPTEKAAGRIRGMRDALDIMQEVYTEQTKQDRPS